MTAMKTRTLSSKSAIAVAVLISLLTRVQTPAAEPTTAVDPDAAAKVAAAAKAAVTALQEKQSKFKPFAEVTKESKKYDGLFDLYQKDDHLYAVIKAGQLDKPFLAPMAIARGIASARRWDDG